MGKKKNTEEYIADARKVHGDRYGYGKVSYTNCRKKVIITCPVHGDFEQTAKSHLEGYGCPDCGGRKQSDTQSFIKRAVEIHGEKYSYDKVVYVKSKDKVTITCPVHGDFEQTANSHLNGGGCCKCRDVRIGDSRRSDKETFIKRAVEIHGEKYSYDKVVYIGAMKRVTITCPVHGDFEQRANSHVQGRGCTKCRDDSRRSDKETFIKRAVEIHGEKYSYDKVVYIGAMKRVTITCPVHGDFEQTASSHLSGQGCPECMVDFQRSDKETFIKRAVEIHGEKYSYDKVVYVKSKDKVTITCPVHGDFEQTASSHLSGNGCPKCTESWSGDGIVYVMSTPEGHNKIGIAKVGTEYRRLQHILRSQQVKSPTAITDLSLVCAYSFNDGSFTEARRFEGKAHRHFKDRRKQFTEKFDGYAEFFTVSVSEICQYLEQQGGQLVTVVSAP